MSQQMNKISLQWPSQHHRKSTTVSRLPLRDWLRDRANRGEGVSYCDGNKNLIKIPWVHASKKSWSQTEHCKLFEDWAIYTGKHNRDAKTYKANFRCALNSLSDVIEQPEHSKKNGHDGFRVFKIVDDPCQFKSRRAGKKKARHAAKVTNHSRSNSYSIDSILSPPISPEGSESSFHNSCSSSNGSDLIKYSDDDVIEECSDPLDFTDVNSLYPYDMSDSIFETITATDELENSFFVSSCAFNQTHFYVDSKAFSSIPDVDDARIPTMVVEMNVDGDDVHESKQRRKSKGKRPGSTLVAHIRPSKRVSSTRKTN